MECGYRRPGCHSGDRSDPRLPRPGEIEDYETIGIAPETILASATVNGAKWLGKEAEFGTIRPRRKGHLLLVDGDPLTRIKDLRNVELVVKDGRVVFRRQ